VSCRGSKQARDTAVILRGSSQPLSSGRHAGRRPCPRRCRRLGLGRRSDRGGERRGGVDTQRQVRDQQSGRRPVCSAARPISPATVASRAAMTASAQLPAVKNVYGQTALSASWVTCSVQSARRSACCRRPRGTGRRRSACRPPRGPAPGAAPGRRAGCLRCRVPRPATECECPAWRHPDLRPDRDVRARALRLVETGPCRACGPSRMDPRIRRRQRRRSRTERKRGRT
jgi:hypothetical protein